MKRTPFILGMALLTGPLMAANPSFQEGKDFGNANKTNVRDQGMLEKGAAESSIRQIRPDYTDRPKEVSTYQARPPRSEGDAKIEFCRTTDPQEMSPQDADECDAINYLVQNAQRENPYTFSEKNDPMFKQAHDIRNTAKSSPIDGSVCQYDAKRPSFDGATQESCTESPGTELKKCTERVGFTPTSDATDLSEGALHFSADYSFITSSQFTGAGGSPNQSTNIHTLYSYNLDTGATDLIKVDIVASKARRVNNILFASPQPTEYPSSFRGKETDPFQEVRPISFSQFPVKKVSSTRETELESEDFFRAIFWDAGTNFFLTNPGFDGGQRAVPPLEPCDDVKCFARSPATTRYPLVEAGRIIGHGVIDSSLFFRAPINQPETIANYKGEAGITATGSRFGLPLTINSTYGSFKLYAGINAAYAFMSSSTRTTAAYIDTLVDANGEMIFTLHDASSSSEVCRVRLGRILPEQALLAPISEQVVLDDRLTTNWMNESCTSREATNVLAQIDSLSNRVLVPAVRGPIVYVETEIQGHNSFHDNRFNLCSTYIPPNSPLRTPPTGVFQQIDANKETRTYKCSVSDRTITLPRPALPPNRCGDTPQEREDYLTAHCTGGRVPVSQQSSSSNPNTETYALHITLVGIGGNKEVMKGDCAIFKKQEAQNAE